MSAPLSETNAPAVAGKRERSQLRELIALSIPLIASNSGGQLMGLVDTAMVGRLGSAALGGVGIGSSIFFALTVAGMGMVLGMDPIVAQAIGAGEHDRARKALWQGIRVALAVSVPIMALVALSPLLLEPLGIEAETARETRSFLFGRLPGLIPMLLFAGVRSYIQAAGGARVVIFAMVAANIANFIGNILLIYGDEGLRRIGLPPIGLPALGVFGSGLSSSIASVFSFVCVVLGVRAIPAPADPSRRALDAVLLRKIVRLGVPISLQLLAEVGAFTLASILAGRMGKEPAAGYQIAIMLASFTFTVTLGISSATAVLVGQAVGRGDTQGARQAGFLALRASLIFMSLTAVAFIAAPEALARILTDEPHVIAAAAPLVQIAGFFQLSDGAQVVAAGALRGAGDTRSAQRANLVGHYLIGLPVAVGLGFGLGLGAPGLWWGLSAGLTFVAVALSLRFHHISKKPLARV
jgi:MATE family multidrug resistance protein